MTPITRRAFLGAGGALVVGLGLGARAPRRAAAQAAAAAPGWPADRYLGKTVAPDQVDAFLAIHADGTVTVFTGKVDLGTGGRAAMRQMVAEELEVNIERITELIEGDTAVCPDQGGTGGSTGITRGGQELRRAAATARGALLALAAQRLGNPVGDLTVADGVVSPRAGGAGVSYGELIGDRQLGLAIDAKAPLKPSSAFRYIGQSVPRPDVPAKVTGRHLYVQNLTLPDMLHGRAIRPPALGATLQSVDESSIAAIPGARVVRIGSFLGVVAEREWDAVRAARAL
ncbi:MAG: molybdopterin cofactor-binding domain-containing protein, partial [Candidatus Rokuibacteriota bacterium]